MRRLEIRLDSRLVTTTTAFLLAAVFFWSGFAKAFDPADFIEAIVRFRIVDRESALLLAFYLPWLEIGLALALISKGWRHSAGAVAAVLLIGFILGAASAQYRGLDIRCGCFGASNESTNPWWLYVRNAGLITLTVPLLSSAMRKNRQKNELLEIPHI